MKKIGHNIMIGAAMTVAVIVVIFFGGWGPSND